MAYFRNGKTHREGIHLRILISDGRVADFDSVEIANGEYVLP